LARNFEIEVQSAFQVLQEYQTEGHSPLQLITERFEVYVVKSSKGQWPPVTVHNELLCAFLLQLWSLKVPDFCLVRVPASVIDIPLRSRNKLSYYDGLCFASKFLRQALEIAPWLIFDRDRQLELLADPLDLLRIGLFDLWVENDDRKPSNPNLLLHTDAASGRLQVYAIDHAYTFLSMSHLDLDPNFGVSQSFNDSILQSEIAKGIVDRIGRTLLPQLEQEFWTRIAVCKENFDSIVKAFPAEIGFDDRLSASVFRFLFDQRRNELVFEEFSQRFF
jgi:hypothetical protein